MQHGGRSVSYFRKIVENSISTGLIGKPRDGDG